MAHAICRTDKMFGTYNIAGLVNVKISADLDNGSVAKVGAMATGEREAYVAEAVAANTALNEVVLICAPEVMYPAELNKLADFYNKSGEIVRGYRLHPGDEFSVTAEALTGTPSLTNKVIELAAGNKMKAVASLTASSTKVGEIVAIEGDFFVIRVQ